MRASEPSSSDSFTVSDKDLLGRVGRITTKGGSFPTPHMFPVVDPNRRLFDQDFFRKLDVHAIMTNAYLHKRARSGLATPENVHETLGFKETVATDSGAYQILEYGKVGVQPAEIVRYQEEIDTDIGVILDVPTGFHSDPERSAWTVTETIKRADESLKVRTRDDILWVGPIQGGVHLKQVARSAREMAKRDFAIYALGSPTELMESQRFEILVDMILTARREVPAGKPLHLFGAGHPAMFSFFVALGCDLFDSAAYALYARTDRYFTSDGTVELRDMEEFPCLCQACSGRTPRKVAKLDFPDRERILSHHNLQACFAELKRIREAIRKGRLWDLLEIQAHTHPALKRCLSRIAVHSGELEAATPLFKPHGIFYFGNLSDRRPEIQRFKSRLTRVPSSPNKLVLLLPGRWRRPYREDSRYRSIVNRFQDEEKVAIVFYSIPFGPVPLELDETYPVAQTESLDSQDPTEYKAKAESVARFITRLKPRLVIFANDGDYGETVERDLLEIKPKMKVVSVPGEKLKPDVFIKLVEKKMR
jgi:7-cyano-7-deazaguanine tRNA-ribosyltransferase